MHVLLVKMSSMGDLIHSLPALTDAMNAIPNLEIDWVVEPAFADIPSWHPAVKNIIPIALRKWRKNIFDQSTHSEIKTFFKTLRAKKYDVIIDAQGLLKSAIVAKCARGKIVGYDKNCAREFYSSYFYSEKYFSDHKEHAVKRTRYLFSKALNYDLPATRPNFHIDFSKLPALEFSTPEKYFVFLHGTTWESKHYPENYWRNLVEKADAKEITVFLPWGNEIEKNRAIRLSENTKHATVLEKISIMQMATFLKNATAVVAGDTGLGHLSAALTTPTIGLYGPTDPNRVGIVGDNQFHLTAHFPCAPCYSKTCWYGRKNKTEIFPTCYSTIAPDKVWELLKQF
ncbi:MAG: lipopolysaccharide heptosyltransferase I [Gammaproteobacteria bacterium RIFCSPHIGHO2_12_FULL_36_30]|nr:MAG: lipopolysaccharide heptosyltransferase I [Gammaproteobacteria bacterium RIFCSPHIGHO2_12_FULL_36_30]